MIRTRHLAENPAFLHPGAERGGLLAVGGQLIGALRPRGIESTPSEPEMTSGGAVAAARCSSP